MKHFVLPLGGNNNTDADVDIIFTIRETKLYVPVATLSAKDNEKLSKHLSKGFEKIIVLE